MIACFLICFDGCTAVSMPQSKFNTNIPVIHPDKNIPFTIADRRWYFDTQIANAVIGALCFTIFFEVRTPIEQSRKKFFLLFIQFIYIVFNIGHY